MGCLLAGGGAGDAHGCLYYACLTHVLPTCLPTCLPWLTTSRGDGSAESPFKEDTRPLQDDLLSLVLRVKPGLARRVDPRQQQQQGWRQWVAGLLQVREEQEQPLPRRSRFSR